jgi:hypothetical protein
LLLMAGCQGGGEPAAPDTGAKDAAVAWFTALANGDDAAARAMLDGEGKPVPADAFARRVQAWRQKLGYRVDRVHVQTCEEHGDSATAHVVLIGKSAGHSRRFEDALVLRRRDGKWLVPPPAWAARP